MFPFSGYSYMMWCGHLYYRDEKYEYLITKQIKNHENIHLQQAKDKGSWIAYYASYIGSWMCGHLLFNGRAAYYTNKYEVEAYAKEVNFKYLETRENNAVDKFKMKLSERIKTFKSASNINQWKVLIRCKFA